MLTLRNRPLAARRICVRGLLGLLVLPAFARAGTDWWSAAGPDRGDILALAVDPVSPNVLYAGGVGSVLKTLDGGARWSFARSGLPAAPVLALAIDPKVTATIYAGLKGFGVYKTTDGGSSWGAVGAGLAATFVFALAVDPASPSTVYAGTDSGVFRTGNGGSSWSLATTGLGARPVFALAIDPKTPSTLYAGTKNAGVFRSTDGATTWTAASTGLTLNLVSCLAVDPRSPATLYAGTGQGVFKSTDGASSWSASGLTAGFAYALSVDPVTTATVYAGVGPIGISKSTDGGRSWLPVTAGLPAPGPFAVVENSYVDALAIDPISPATLYAGTQLGIWKSIDGAGAWSGSNNGLAALKVFAVAADPSVPSTVYAGTDLGLFKSVDAAATWTRILNGPGEDPVFALMVRPGSPSTVFVGHSGGTLRSTDGGASWTQLSVGSALAFTVDPSAPATCYAAGFAGPPGQTSGVVSQSTDGGLTWSNFGTQTVGLPNVNAVLVDPTARSAIYAGTDAGIYKTFYDTVGMKVRWNASAALGASRVFALAQDPASPSTVYAGTDGGLYKTTNAGVSWTQAPNGPAAGKVFALTFDAASSTFYAGSNASVFKSTDGGASWTAMNQGLRNLVVEAFAVAPGSPETLYAGTNGSSVFQLGPSGTCVATSESLCLSGSRFRVRVAWRAGNTSGSGQAVPLSSDTGTFWFFQSTNVELVIKVLDARALNGRFWVFFGALSNVEYRITVTDEVTGEFRTYFNPQNTLASVADTSAFPLGAGVAAAAGASRTEATPPRELQASDASSGERSPGPERTGGSCVPGPTALCLSGGRFRLEVAWRAAAQATSGVGQAVSLTADTGYFWFFQATNVELIIKVLDARVVNGRFWVFYGALSNVEYTITVTDTATGAVKTYFNPQDTLASVADTSAF